MNVNIGLALRSGSSCAPAPVCVSACVDVRARRRLFHASPEAFVTAPEPSEDARSSAERILLGMCGG